MGNDYARYVEEDRRLVILRALEEDPGYSMNESVIQSVLASFGHRVGRDRVQQDLAWLAEQGLVKLELVISVQVATLTARGADAATGRSRVPGVKRPGPGRS